MKNKITLGLTAVIASLFGVMLISDSASALPISDVLDTCSDWSSTLNRANLTCVRQHQSSSPGCTASGGTEIDGNSSSITCQWQRSDLVPTVRTDAGKVCTYIWEGVWSATEASCVADSDKFSNYGSCSDWGGTVTNTGSHGEMTCQWKTLVPGYDPDKPDDGDSDSDDDDDDDDDDGDEKVPLADVEEGKCSSILPESWCSKDSSDGITEIINWVVTILTGAVVIAGTIGIIICGVMWMTARDNESQVATAKRRMLDIVIGIVAWVLLALLANLFIPKTPEDINSDAGISTTNSKGIKG